MNGLTNEGRKKKGIKKDINEAEIDILRKTQKNVMTADWM
jgi:hypothetical protein